MDNTFKNKIENYFSKIYDSRIQYLSTNSNVENISDCLINIQNLNLSFTIVDDEDYTDSNLYVDFVEMESCTIWQIQLNTKIALFDSLKKFLDVIIKIRGKNFEENIKPLWEGCNFEYMLKNKS